MREKESKRFTKPGLEKELKLGLGKDTDRTLSLGLSVSLKL